MARFLRNNVLSVCAFLISIIILLLLLGVDNKLTTGIATAFGLAGMGIIIVYSRQKGKMIHCILHAIFLALSRI
jgi:hypothetical protein